MTDIKTHQTLLRNAINNRLKCEYMTPEASPAKRKYYEGRIAALLQCMTTDPADALAKSSSRWTTEHHAPGDDITYPEGTSVQWMAGCIQAVQDLISGTSVEQAYDSPIVL